MSLKKSSDTVGNRTRNFPACSAVRVRRKEIELIKEVRKNKKGNDEPDHAGMR
jgi:hypothetical protein